LSHVLGRAVELAERRYVAGNDAVQVALHLGRDHVFLALPLDRAPDQLLVGERPVDLRGVDEVDAELEGALDGRNRLLLVGLAVERGHSHAAEPELRDIQVTKRALIHLLPNLSQWGSCPRRFPPRQYE